MSNRAWPGGTCASELLAIPIGSRRTPLVDRPEIINRGLPGALVLAELRDLIRERAGLIADRVRTQRRTSEGRAPYSERSAQ